MQELVTSRTVSINVGPNHDSVNVSTVLFQGISEPLHKLLSSYTVANGDTSEINKYLQCDDKDAFLQVIAMAYDTILKGNSTPQLQNPGESPTKRLLDVSKSILTLVKCRDCKVGNVWLDANCESCKAPHLQYGYGLEFFFELQLHQSHKVASHVLSVQGGRVPNPELVNPTTGKPYPLIHFAKLFNLGAKWRVKNLQDSSLLGFTNRLRRYAKTSPVDETVEELLDVLRYLAAIVAASGDFVIRKTSDDVCTDTEQTMGVTMLLGALMRYICVHLRVLLTDVEFRQIVAEYGVIGLILFDVLEETMIASKGDENSA